MFRAWQNESTFEKHDQVSNVAATMCPRFAGHKRKWVDRNEVKDVTMKTPTGQKGQKGIPELWCLFGLYKNAVPHLSG